MMPTVSWKSIVSIKCPGIGGIVGIYPGQLSIWGQIKMLLDVSVCFVAFTLSNIKTNCLTKVRDQKDTVSQLVGHDPAVGVGAVLIGSRLHGKSPPTTHHLDTIWFSFIPN